MNPSSNPLDDLFKDKLSDRPYPVNMDHWDQATKMLDEDKPKRRSFIWFFWGGLSLILILGSAYWIMRPELSSDNTTSSLVEAPSQLRNTQPEKKALGADLAPEAAKKSLSTQNRMPDEKGRNDAQVIPVSAEKTIHTVEENQPITSQASIQTSIEKLPDHVLVQNAPSQSASNQSSESSTSTSVSNFSEAILPARDFFFADLLPPRFVEPLVTLETTGLSSGIMPPSNPIDPNIQRFKMGFYLEGLMNPIHSDQASFAGFKLGLIGRYQMTSKLYLEFGPGYHQYKGLKMYSKLRQDAIYDFGLSTEIYGMQAQTAHFISLPISFLWSPQKHGIELGVDLNYLLGVQGLVQQVTLENVVNEIDLTRTARVAQVVESISSGWLDMTPFGELNPRFMLGYQYKVNRGFNVGFRGYYQPKSILTVPPAELETPSHAKLFIGLQAKFIIE